MPLTVLTPSHRVIQLCFTIINFGVAPTHYRFSLPHMQVKYCGVECQKLAWTVGNHKKLCKKWTLKQAEQQPQSPGHLKQGNLPAMCAGDGEGHLKEKESPSVATSGGDHQLKEDCTSQVGAPMKDML